MSHYTQSIAQHIDQLSRAIGTRHSGSANCRAAAEYISNWMQKQGLDVETQKFPCPAWTCETAELTINNQTAEVLANTYSPSCDVAAPVIPAATLAELETAEIGGRIALPYGDLTREPIACKSWFLKEERDERIIQLLEEKKPAAVLTVQIRPGSVNRLIEDWEFTLPSATLPNESALVLFQNLQTPVHLRLQTRQQPDSTANIVGRLKGQRPETIVFCAHYDTKIDTPGAGDNAAGVAALLALAEHYAQTRPQASLEFVAFTNEEYLPIGDDTYLERAGEDFLNRVMLAVNFDGLGHILDCNTLAIYASSEPFTARVTEISRDFPAVQWVDPWPQSNHSTFSFRGVPALAFGSRAAVHYSHQRDDSARWINPARIDEAVLLTTRIIAAIEAQPLAWLRQSE
jgi:aminopeptidase YwaD